MVKSVPVDIPEQDSYYVDFIGSCLCSRRVSLYDDGLATDLCMIAYVK